jgi:amphi-Trp domain-containing protein
MDKEFQLRREDAASFLRDVAESLEEGDSVAIDGDDWKVFQPVGGSVPLRIFSNEEELEIGFKVKDSNSED